MIPISSFRYRSNSALNSFYSLQLCTQTWAKDVYELVDYDSSDLFSSEINIRSNSYIYRESNQVISYPEKSNKKNDLLFQITTYMGKDISYEIWTNSFHIDESNNISQNSAWFLLKPGKTDIKSNKYKLNPGDILKIGRITLRIRDIYFSNKKDTSSLLNESNCTNINIKEMNTLKTEGEPLNNNTNINPSKT